MAATRWRRGSTRPASTKSRPWRRATAIRLGTAARPVLVGGVDLEMAQPRLNEAVLQAPGCRQRRGTTCAPTRRGSCRRYCASREPRPARPKCATSGTMGGALRRSSACSRPSGWPATGGIGVDAPRRARRQTHEEHETDATKQNRFVPFVSVLRVHRGASPSTAAAAENRWAVIISGASGGDKYAEQMRDVAQRPADRARRSLSDSSRSS